MKRILLTLISLVTLTIGAQAQFPALEPLFEKHLAAAQDFDRVCSAMDAQLGAANSAIEIAAIFQGFNQSADKYITACKEMVAAIALNNYLENI